MNIQCVDCDGTGRRLGSRCNTCRGSKINEIEPTEYLRQNKIRASRSMSKLIRV